MHDFPTSDHRFPPSRLTIGISVGFVCVIVVMPVIQFLGELFIQPGNWPTALKLIPDLVHAVQNGGSKSGSAWQKGMNANSSICDALRTYETEVTTSAWPIRGTRDRLQAFLSSTLASGNEQVDIGRAGWMFFRPDVDALTAPGFLQPAVTRPGMTKSIRQTNPLPAIRQFAVELNLRGIELLLLPIPSKASIHLANREVAKSPIHNADFHQFQRQFAGFPGNPEDAADVVPARLIGDLDRKFQAAVQSGIPCYLKTDTHWTPEGLEIAAQAVAGEVRMSPWWRETAPVSGRNSATWRQETRTVIEKLGDTATLLGNMAQVGWKLESVVPTRVTDQNGSDWKPDSNAKILVLGDSFCNIYSQPELGWGSAAGFIEHLSYALGVPLDRITINAGGALASRQDLLRQMQQGRNPLAGKKLVVWAFAERELTFGDWQVLPLPEVGPLRSIPKPSRDAVQSAGIEVTGDVIQVGRMVNPQSMPYREALLPIHLKVNRSSKSGDVSHSTAKIEGSEIVVYVWGLKDRRPTSAAEKRVGQVLRLRLIPWSQAEAQYGRFARIELDDPDSVLLDLPTYWGEIVEGP